MRRLGRLSDPGDDGDLVGLPAKAYQGLFQGIEQGVLYRYCPEPKLYKCPTGIRGEYVTYAITDAMNGYDGIPGTKNLTRTSRNHRG